jgi:hypothetical protein
MRGRLCRCEASPTSCGKDFIHERHTEDATVAMQACAPAWGPQRTVDSEAGRADARRQEYALALRMCGRGDFAEGVRAQVVDKDRRPAWQPARLEEVSTDLLDALFAPMPEGRGLRLEHTSGRKRPRLGNRVPGDVPAPGPTT